MAQKESTRCKVCGQVALETFRIPSSKLTDHPIPNEPNDCIYFECLHCGFCFTPHFDSQDHSEIYDEGYWATQDPDWIGRTSQSLRLIWLASTLIDKEPWELDILDFGCGMGAFVDHARKELQLRVWGTDIITPKMGTEFFLREIGDREFDVIIACEVIEHLPDPLGTFHQIVQWLRPGGVFAFQTAYFDRNMCGRDWWYVGPANGHISFYSEAACSFLFQTLGGTRRIIWSNYPGIQAWQFTQGEPSLIEIRPEQMSFHQKSCYQDGLISFSGEPLNGDSVCYGPYIEVTRGRYVIELEGEIKGRFMCTLTDEFGRERIGQAEIHDEKKQFEFKLYKNANKFECVIQATGCSESLSIGKIVIRPSARGESGWLRQALGLSRFRWFDKVLGIRR